MMTEVVRVEPQDLAALSELIAEAFFDLPPSPWLISDETARREIFPAYFRLYLEDGMAHGQVDTTPDWAGAALWLPVGLEPPVPPDGYKERLAAVTAPWTSRFLAFDVSLEARHSTGRAHHHLALLGVRQCRQGRGIGSALLQAHHQQLDESGLPAYLEASSQRSRKLYQRHGYEDLGPPIDLPDGPGLFPYVAAAVIASTPAPRKHRERAHLACRHDRGIQEANRSVALRHHAPTLKRGDMARKVRTITTDDLDGTAGAETVRFSVGDLEYEIDLGPANSQRLREFLQPFTSAGRRIGQKKPRRPSASRADLADIRTWARNQGMHVAERGRICAYVVNSYDAAHSKG